MDGPTTEPRAAKVSVCCYVRLLRSACLDIAIGLAVFDNRFSRNERLVECSVANDTITLVSLDINECATSNGGCDSKRTCTNTAGSMKCENCPSGWANNGAKLCKGLPQLVD